MDFADEDGDGFATCEEISHDLDWVISADDAQTLDIAGVCIGAFSGWSTSDTISTTLDSGPHALGVYAHDSGGVIAGLISAVSIDGVRVSLTGDGRWRWATGVTSDWADADFDDSSWSAPSQCSPTDVSKSWGTKPTDLTGAGAKWVWYQSCTSLGAACCRLSLTLDGGVGAGRADTSQPDSPRRGRASSTPAASSTRISSDASQPQVAAIRPTARASGAYVTEVIRAWLEDFRM